MDMKKVYIPDVSSFFADGKKYSVKDIMNRAPIVQESVFFERNDMHKDIPITACANITQKSVRKYGKKRRNRKINTKFKRT